MSKMKPALKPAITPPAPVRRAGLWALHGAIPPLTFVMVVLVVMLPALRPLVKFAPFPLLAVPTVALLVVASLWAALSAQALPLLRRLMATPWPTAMLVVLCALLAAFVYPIADGLKVRMGGSDADDAMILAGTALAHLHNPYVLTTYFGNPFSPGPGWAALVAPLAVLGFYPLLSALAIGLLATVLRATKHSWVQTNMLLVSLLTCLLLWELVAVGNDLPAWGMLFLAVLLLLGRPRVGTGQVLALSIVLGSLCTARIAFFYVPVLVGFSLLAVWPKRAIQVAVVGSLTLLVWHGAFYALNPAFYPPLHLLTRAHSLLDGPSLYAALLVLGVVGLQQLYHWRWWPPATQAAFGLGTPLFILALAELAHVLEQGGTLAQWEGATFWVPAMPVVLYALLKPNFRG